MSKIVDIQPYIDARRVRMSRFARPIVDYPEVREARELRIRQINALLDQYLGLEEAPDG